MAYELLIRTNKMYGFVLGMNGEDMPTVLLISEKQDNLAGLVEGLNRNPGIRIIKTDSTANAIAAVFQHQIDLVVVDEVVHGLPALKVTEMMIKKNPMVNFAVVDSSDPQAFHEESEGLGILMQLPAQSGPEQADILVEKLRRVASIRPTLP